MMKQLQLIGGYLYVSGVAHFKRQSGFIWFHVSWFPNMVVSIVMGVPLYRWMVDFMEHPRHG